MVTLFQMSKQLAKKLFSPKKLLVQQYLLLSRTQIIDGCSQWPGCLNGLPVVHDLCERQNTTQTQWLSETATIHCIHESISFKLPASTQTLRMHTQHGQPITLHAPV